MCSGPKRTRSLVLSQGRAVPRVGAHLVGNGLDALVLRSPHGAAMSTSTQQMSPRGGCGESGFMQWNALIGGQGCERCICAHCNLYDQC